MKLSTKSESILTQIVNKNTKLGDLRNIAKDIKKDNQLAMELWSTEHFFARQLAILIMDKKLLTEEVIDNLVADINQHNERRTFWYYQARLRWTGQPQPGSENLLSKIENKIIKEQPEVQWAMNFTTGWIGVYEKAHRNRCVALGANTGLYKGQMVSKGCTPDYLPEFITIESNKRKL